jgi:hypothetical protein
MNNINVDTIEATDLEETFVDTYGDRLQIAAWTDGAVAVSEATDDPNAETDAVWAFSSDTARRMAEFLTRAADIADAFADALAP